MSADRRGSAVFAWTDRALFLGDRSETSLHSHHAVELALALDDQGIYMAGAEAPDLRGVAGAVVRSDAGHRLAIPGPKVAVLYVDPRTPEGRGLHAWLSTADIRPLPAELLADWRSDLHALFELSAGLVRAQALTDRILQHLAPTPPRPALDFRIRRALRFLGGRLSNPPTQAEVAREVGLSAGRFGHLFRDEVGLPMRRYLLWMRLRVALTEALRTGRMTDAALAAGFSDAAHFTRTCRRMFGLPPTAFAPVDAVFVSDPPT